MKDLKKKLKRFFRATWPFFLIVALVAGFFWKVLVKGYVALPGDFVVGVYYPWLDYAWGAGGMTIKNPMTADVVSLIYPEQMLGVDLMKSGEWPLWNPYILAGTPLLANLQAAPFSPTIGVYWLFDRLTAWNTQIMLQHILAGIFTYVLLRHWKVSKLAAVFGGVVFAFSGFNMIFSQWNGHALSAAFIPLAVYFLDKWLLMGKGYDGLGLAVTLALQVMSGYPQVSFYTAFVLGMLWLVRLGEMKGKILKRSGGLAIFGLLALGLAAVQLWPAYELWQISQRGLERHPAEWAFLPWRKIITLVAPDFFGNHATGNYWGPQDYTSNTGFVGVVAMVAALVSLQKIRKNREILYLGLLMAFSLVMSFRTVLPVFLWKNDILGMGAASAHRITVVFNFSVACLAGLGIDYFKKKKLKLRSALILVYLLIGVFGLAAVYLNFTDANPVMRGIEKYMVGLRSLMMPMGILVLVTAVLKYFNRLKRRRRLGVSLLLGLMVVELFGFGWKFTPFSPREYVFPETPILEFLGKQEGIYRVTGNKVIPNNLRTPYNLESPEGYETIQSLRTSAFIASLNAGKPETKSVRRYGIIDNDTSRLLDLVNTKYYLALKDDSSRFEAPRFKEVFEDKSVIVFESTSVLPRAVMVYDWEVEENDEKILEKLLDKNFPWGKKVILEEEVGGEKGDQVEQVGKVEYKGYKRQESVVEVETETDGLLFVSDAYYPGWKAFVDGEETKIYRANYAFRAIEVPEGKHEVRMVYKPESFYWGLRISLVTLAVVGFIIYLREAYE